MVVLLLLICPAPALCQDCFGSGSYVPLDCTETTYPLQGAVNFDFIVGAFEGDGWAYWWEGGNTYYDLVTDAYTDCTCNHQSPFDLPAYYEFSYVGPYEDNMYYVEFDVYEAGYQTGADCYLNQEYCVNCPSGTPMSFDAWYRPSDVFTDYIEVDW